MPDEMRAVFFFLVTLLAISVLAHLVRSAGPYMDGIASASEETKTGQYHCGTKLRVMGYDVRPQSHKAKNTEEQKRFYDICQQIRSAEAAEESAVYASRTYYWTIANVVLVATTALFAFGAFWQTRRQADATIVAIKHAETGAKAAVAAVAFQARLEKPVLVIGNIETHIDVPDAGPLRTIHFTIQNIGRSPAIVTEWSMDCSVSDSLPSTPNHRNTVIGRGRLFLANERDRYTVYLTTEQADAVIHRLQTIHVWGYFRYEDVFGGTHRMGFGLRGTAYGDPRTFIGVTWGRAGGQAYNYDRTEPERQS